ncbi:ribose-5-phosphate isomerase RpiA [Halanaeroarchaeum sulfurireducens]|uniref:Ribose-5-phosphate isomerase A n=1 Tax=Halanaeroarchaeum sulfurireducens TaxID=1604004 RepID=A0A0F7PH00_9EURY|nr:ribose-5-phosphate isomerase RpiA [Halanaeroarchaeum sulfurireducens]AKH98538.1 ribose-5-phosphate isomerase A [Halanaeroarchaeum sulfurireducens]ALG82980.1 ribose-5-phosphate isomerase A [Halanaeroarchaeum sulfurireducens]
MKTQGGSSDAKRRAGESAANLVVDGMVVGLGTGSTAAHAIDALGEAVDAGLDVRGIATSYQSRRRALEAGIPLTTLDAVDRVDVAIDGADQVADRHLLKGGGAAHAREKVVDGVADRFVVVVDSSKTVETLSRPVPLAVLPDAEPVVERAVEDVGGDPELRTATAKDGPVVTDDGNLVLDCSFGPIEDPAGLASTLSSLPGVVEHGLFVGMVDEIHVGTDGDVTVERFD